MYFILKLIFKLYDCRVIFLIILFCIKELKRRRHLKLFTNCHVSWDTLYQTTEQFMEEDILNYLSTVMFRGTPCMSS